MAGFHGDAYDPLMDRDALTAEIDAFVDAQRDRSLWFLAHDYHPQTDDERRWVLSEIQRRADRATFVRAAELKRCLPRPESAREATGREAGRP